MYIRIIFISFATLMSMSSAANDNEKFYKQIDHARRNPQKGYSKTHYTMGFALGFASPIGGAVVAFRRLNEIQPDLNALEQNNNVNRPQLDKYHELRKSESRLRGLMSGSLISAYICLDLICSMASDKLETNLKHELD